MHVIVPQFYKIINSDACIQAMSEVLLEAQDAISDKKFDSLITSMLCRVQAVIKVDG